MDDILCYILRLFLHIYRVQMRNTYDILATYVEFINVADIFEVLDWYGFDANGFYMLIDVDKLW